MRKLCLLTLLLVAAFAGAAAQISYDTVSATITSKNGFPYANARYQFQLVGPTGYPIESAITPNGQIYTAKLIMGQFDANGSFSAKVPPNTLFTSPTNTHWHLMITAPTDYFILHDPDIHYWTINYDVTVTGDVDLSTQLSALSTDVSYANLQTNQNTFGGNTGGTIPATTNVLKGDGNGNALATTVTDDGTNATRAPNGLDTATSGNFQEFTAATGGVTAGQALCVTGTNDTSGRPEVSPCATNSLGAGFAGIAHSTVTAGATIEVCWTVNCPALFDNATTQLHEAVISTTTAGEMHDTGSTIATSGQSNFSVLSANTGAGTTALIGISDATANNPKGGGGSRGGGTTINALTAATTGGAAPGTSFNGSAAVTLDYHSFGAQQALTLTTTGTSGAATLAGSALNIPQYAGAGGNAVQYNDPTTTYYIVGDSIAGVTSSCVETALPSDAATITASTVSGGVLTATATNTYSSGCVVTLSGFTGGYTALNGQVVTISATGLSGTQFEAAVTGVADGTSGTGNAQATYNLTGDLSREPYVNGHGTVINNATSNQSIAQLVSAYTTTAHLYSPAVTGKPGFLIVFNGTQDLYNGTSLATMESGMQTYWATAHADGWTILQTTVVGYYPQGFTPAPQSQWLAFNAWLKTQGPTATNASSKQYWDRIVYLDNLLPNGFDSNYFIQSGAIGHLTDMGNKVSADIINESLGVQGTKLQGNFTCNIINNCASLNGTNTFTNDLTVNPDGSVGDAVLLLQRGTSSFLKLDVDTNNRPYIFASNGASFDFNSGDDVNQNSSQIFSWNLDVGLSRDSAGVLDVGNGTFGSKTGSMKMASLIPGILYSAAATPLPTCAVGIRGEQAVVSDATSPTYMGAYASGGGITTAVICSFDGTTYSWKTH